MEGRNRSVDNGPLLKGNFTAVDTHSTNVVPSSTAANMQRTSLPTTQSGPHILTPLSFPVPRPVSGPTTTYLTSAVPSQTAFSNSTRPPSLTPLSSLASGSFAVPVNVSTQSTLTSAPVSGAPAMHSSSESPASVNVEQQSPLITTAPLIEDLDYGDISIGDDEESIKSGNPTKNPIPAFISKLTKMINDPETDSLISWTESGLTFKVHDAATLARDVLPLYFKHSNFTSLVRQLNMYGFHKVVGVDSGGLKTASDQIWEFIHPCVQRDKPHLLKLVKRKEGSSTKRKMTRKDVDNVITDLSEIKGEQAMLAVKFQDMQRQNAALWQEVTQLRRKHEHQQRMISKIMVFLSRVVTNRQPQAVGPSTKRAKTLALEHTWEPGALEGSEQPVTSTWDAAISPSVNHLQQGVIEPPLDLDQPPSQAFQDRLFTLSNPERAEDVENIIGPELSLHDERITAHKARLAEGGFDDHFLQSLWAAAEDESAHDPLPVLSPNVSQLRNGQELFFS